MQITRRHLIAALGLSALSQVMTAIPASAFAETQLAPLVMGYAQVGAESEWRTANTKSIKESAQKDGVTLKFADAQQRQENQVKAIRSFIAQKVDVIAFSPVVESGWETVLREAKAAKIPVIITDRAVNVTDPSLFVTFIGSDFVEEGRRAGNWLLERSRKMPGAAINIVELQGTVGSAPAIDRKAGFEQVIASNPRLKIIRSQTGDFTRAKGKEVMEAFLKSDGKNIQVVYAHNDDMALGAIQAIEEVGLRPGVDILVISIDGVRGAFEAMVAGKMNVTVECNPLLGAQLMQTARDIHAGKTVPRRITIAESVYPADTAARELPNRKYY